VPSLDISHSRAPFSSERQGGLDLVKILVVRRSIWWACQKKSLVKALEPPVAAASAVGPKQGRSRTAETGCARAYRYLYHNRLPGTASVDQWVKLPHSPPCRSGPRLESARNSPRVFSPFRSDVAIPGSKESGRQLVPVPSNSIGENVTERLLYGSSVANLRRQTKMSTMYWNITPTLYDMRLLL